MAKGQDSKKAEDYHDSAELQGPIKRGAFVFEKSVNGFGEGCRW